MEVALVVLAVVALVPIARWALARKVWRAPAGEEFSGSLLRLGENLVSLPDRSHLPADAVSRTTLICFPGFKIPLAPAKVLTGPLPGFP